MSIGVVQGLTNTNLVATNERRCFGQRHAQLACGLGAREQPDDFTDDRANIMLLDMQAQLPRLALRHVDEVAEHSLELRQLPGHPRDQPAQLRLGRKGRIRLEHVDGEPQRRQRDVGSVRRA